MTSEVCLSLQSSHTAVPQHQFLRLAPEIHSPECSAAAQQAAAEQLSPLATFVVNRSLSQVFPVNLLAVLKAEDTKLSIPKAICDPSDLPASRHANALALRGLHDIVLSARMLYY